jgi:hypothetical protein
LDNVQIHAGRALSPIEIQQIAAGEQVADGLTAYYDFEGKNLAEQLEDKSGNDNRLTSTGVAPKLPIFDDQFAIFDEQGDVLKTEDAAGIALGADYTLSATFTGLAPNGLWRTLFRGPSSDHQIIVHKNNGMLGMHLTNEGGFKSSGYNAMVLNDGQPHTISAVASGSTTTFYVDGSQVGSVAYKSTAAIYAIGNYQYGGQRFADNLDNVQIHAGRALSPIEIQQIAAGEQVADGLTAFYDFQGTNLAEQLEDKSGNGNTLTSTGVTIIH